MNKYGIHIYRTAICLFLLVLVMACSNDEDLAEKQKNEATNAALAKELQLKTWSSKEVRVLLTQKKFAELEQIFTALADNFKSDHAQESPWIYSFASFKEIADRNGSEEAYLPLFSEWIENSDSYIPYAARGHFLLGLAFHTRGGRFISETSDEQLAGMRDFRKLALDDFARVLKKNPDFLPAYFQQVSAGMLTGADKMKVNALQNGLRIAPNSFWLRSVYLDSITPSWGGSYKEMKKFIRGFEEVARQNPRLWSLRGTPDAHRAKRLGGAQEYKDAVDYYTKALAYGDRLYWLRHRAYYNYRQKEYDSVIHDMKRVATYGRGEESVLFILENIEIERSAAGNAHPRLTWASFDFET
jgi:hypothetical protein